MSSSRFVIPLGAALTLGGCVVATPPTLVAAPGQNKDAAAFERDESSCRQQASQAAYISQAPGGAPVDTKSRSGNAAAWQRYDTSYAQCMTGHGDSVQPAAWAGVYGGYPAAYGYPYGVYGYPFAYGYPYGLGYFGYPGFYGGFYPGFGFGFGGFGFGGYGRFGGGYGGGFGHGGFGGHGGGGGHR